jgi:subtilisin family serine protease
MVDIICLPFGFPRLVKELQCIQDAIAYACSKKIILMAAAANSGGLHNVAYPGNQDEVICVNSTDGEGNSSHFNPSPEGTNAISALGEAVPSQWYDLEHPFIPVARKTGTSFAVPVAAGIAAIVLDYIDKRQISWDENKKYLASKIRTRKGMLAVMQTHLSVARQGFWFLRPWDLFEKDFEMIDQLLLATLRNV